MTLQCFDKKGIKQRRLFIWDSPLELALVELC